MMWSSRRLNADGSAAALENTSKPTLTFTATDIGFKQVAAQVWAAAQMSEFRSSRYELAVAIARTTMRDPDRASGRVRTRAGGAGDRNAAAMSRSTRQSTRSIFQQIGNSPRDPASSPPSHLVYVGLALIAQ